MTDNLPPALADRLKEIDQELRSIADQCLVLAQRRDELLSEKALRVSTAAICREAWCSPPENEPSMNAHGLTPEWHAPPVQEARKRRTSAEIRDTILTCLSARPRSWFDVPDLSHLIRVARATTEGHLQHLLKAGRLETAGGNWRLANPAPFLAAKPAIPSGSDPVPAGPPQDTERAADG